jgi:hypothetical protein
MQAMRNNDGTPKYKKKPVASMTPEIPPPLQEIQNGSFTFWTTLSWTTPFGLFGMLSLQSE